MTRGLKRFVAAPALFALVLQGSVGAGLVCEQAEGAHASIAGSHSMMDMDAGPTDSGVEAALEGVVGGQQRDSDHPAPCTMLGHCAASLATHTTLAPVVFAHRAQSPAFPGWVLHGAPEFGLTPPPKV